jgi:PTS system mannose-specific IIA component
VYGIVIVAHAGLADEYLSAMEHVVGKQPGTAAVPVGAECDRMERKTAIHEAIEEADEGDGVVVVTDIYGGTPSNLALNACDTPNRRVLYGANLPLLIKLATLRDKPLNEAIEEAITAARKYINCTDGKPA